MMSRLALPLAAGLFTLALPAVAANWPQWRGPDRSGVSKETGLLKRWPKDGPKLLWTYDKGGAGFSQPAVVGDRLFLSGARGDSEFVFALDLSAARDGTVKEVWAARIGPTFKGNNWNYGPIATPSVDGELTYALGGGGDLVAVETATGNERWRSSLLGDLKGEVNPIGGGLGADKRDPHKLGWGYATSPLVDGERLVSVPGGPEGLLAALNKRTGKLLWQTKEVAEQAPYSSPIVAEVNGVRQYIQMTYSGVMGVAADNGRLLWYYKRKPPYDDVLIPTPILRGDSVYITSGHRQQNPRAAGCDLVRLVASGQELRAEQVYQNRIMSAQQGGVVLVGGHVYGYSESEKGWVCQDFQSGKLVWSEKRALGRGSVTAADGRLYCLGENVDERALALVQASPAGWKESGRLIMPKQSELRRPRGMLWTPPVIANGRLYLRDQELLFCYDIKDSGGK
jgi:outer membrane protein assembly factor BamB